MNVDSDPQNLTVEQKKEIDKKYNAILEMFNTEGWKHFTEDNQSLIKQLRDMVNDMPDDKVVSAVNYNRGFAACASYETVVRNQHEQWLEFQAGEADNAPV